MKPARIFVVANGPSAYSDAVKYQNWNLLAEMERSRVFRTNYFFLTDGDPMGYDVTDWFMCEDPHDCRLVRAVARFGEVRPVIWIPGTEAWKVEAITENHLAGFDVRVQKTYARLPPRCRWEKDLAPERPLMGSFALAVAVGMQPEYLYLAGHDLFEHPSNTTHAGAKSETRDWQESFNEAYLNNTHRNHRHSGDLKYIQNALDAFEGTAVIVGSVLRGYFENRYKGRKWEWHNG